MGRSCLLWWVKEGGLQGSGFRCGLVPELVPVPRRRGEVMVCAEHIWLCSVLNCPGLLSSVHRGLASKFLVNSPSGTGGAGLAFTVWRGSQGCRAGKLWRLNPGSLGRAPAHCPASPQKFASWMRCWGRPKLGGMELTEVGRKEPELELVPSSARIFFCWETEGLGVEAALAQYGQGAARVVN